MLRCVAAMNNALLFRFLRLLDHRPLRGLMTGLHDLCARAAGLDPVLREALRDMPDEHPVFYATATLVWLLLVRVRGPLPPYNIYKVLTSAEQSAAAARLCERYIEKRPTWRVRRQLVFLRDYSPDSAEIREQATRELERYLNTARSTPAKEGVRFDRHAAAIALADLDRLFAGLGQPMFLISGTFLGAVRNGGFIASEYDIDVGFFTADIGTDTVVQAMHESPKFIQVSANDKLIKAVHVKGTTVDVFAHFEERGLIWHGSNKHRWYNTPFELKPINLLGRDYLAPADADVYLTENYGDWRSPCAFWDTSFDTPNRVFPYTKEALLMLVNFAKNPDNRYRAQLALKALKDTFAIDFTDQIPTGGSKALRERLDPRAVTLVFGDFDGLNVAALRCLEQAGADGSRVVAAVSSDALFAEDEGSAPASCAADRRDLVAALACVERAFVDDGGAGRAAEIEALAPALMLAPASRCGSLESLGRECQVVEIAAANG